MIGAIGSRSMSDVIMFEVSTNPDNSLNILTPHDFQRRNSVRFAKHDTLDSKPVSQYIGPDLDVIDFRIDLKAQFGVNPRTEMSRLMQLQSSGAALTIIMGNWVQGVARWKIVSLGMLWEVTDNNGNCVSCTVDIGFEEYV